jgi:hypothetical protein
MRTEQEIKNELERLKIEMDKYNKLALTNTSPYRSTEHFHTKANNAAIRYLAIRWVMGWENEIPKEENNVVL